MKIAVGKRYRCTVCGAEFLATRPGDLPTCDGRELEPIGATTTAPKTEETHPPSA